MLAGRIWLPAPHHLPLLRSLVRLRLLVPPQVRLLAGPGSAEGFETANLLHLLVLLLHQYSQLFSLLRDVLLFLLQLVLVRDLLTVELGLQELELLMHRSQVVEKVFVGLGVAVVEDLNESLCLATVCQ